MNAKSAELASHTQDELADLSNVPVMTTTSSSDLPAGDYLVVSSGDQTGACLNVNHQDGFSVGTGYDNDIVLRCKLVEPVKLRVDYLRNKRRIQLLEGAASVAGEELKIGQTYAFPDDKSVVYGNVVFEIRKSGVEAAGISANEQTSVAEPSRHTGALVALLAGGLLLVGIVLQDYLIADANGPEPELTLQEQIDELGLKNLEIAENPEIGLPVVQGRVAGREEFSQLVRLKDAEPGSFTLDLQIDEVLLDAVQDLYRNHGIAADIKVEGVGHLRVETEGADEEALAVIEDALATDVPMLDKLDAVNTPAEIEDEPKQVAALDPGKEVEAVIAGSISYVLTRDQSRYFVGAVMPSGHTIKSISEGKVVMLREGEETQLEF